MTQIKTKHEKNIHKTLLLSFRINEAEELKAKSTALRIQTIQSVCCVTFQLTFASVAAFQIKSLR